MSKLPFPNARASAISLGSTGIGRPVASATRGASITQPSSPPTNIKDEIFGPIIQPTARSAGEVATPP